MCLRNGLLVVLVTMQLAKFVSLCMYVYTSAERQDKHRKPLYYHLLGTIYMSTSM